jgi:serine/threonine protein kinase
MKFYEGSVGDKMAHLPGNKLPLGDVLRYGQQLVSGIMELHSRGILALNLKPCNFLVDNQNMAVVGEFGIPMLLGGIHSPFSEHPYWLGSPNYMAPEQWGTNLRGPISLETDCWAFACSIIEMITGEMPWNHFSPQDIFDAVVVRHQKPLVPSGLHPAVDRVLKACFEYDYRSRPTFGEILCAFTK